MSSSILTNWLENSTGRYFAPKTFDTLVFMQSASQTQGKLVDLPTYFQEAVFNREIKIDLSHNNTCAFGSMEEGSWPGVTGILGTANGGTGNADGYIRTGAYPGSYIGTHATAEGNFTFAWGVSSHIEGGAGHGNSLTGHQGMPEGINQYSNNEEIIAGWRDFGITGDGGGFSLAKGMYSHVEGNGNLALGISSHAQGTSNIALGHSASVSGAWNEANGDRAFAVGYSNIANGENSFVAGYENIAYGENSFIIGKCAKTTTDDNLVFVVGNGTNSINNKSNAFTVDWDGNAFISNNLSVGGSVTIAGNIVPETDGYMVGTTNQPWTDVIAWNIGADDITSAFGGLRIANGTAQIELIQNDKITLTSSQVDLNCGAITLSNTNYGYELPETGIEGQVFFLLLEE